MSILLRLLPISMLSTLLKITFICYTFFCCYTSFWLFYLRRQFFQRLVFGYFLNFGYIRFKSGFVHILQFYQPCMLLYLSLFVYVYFQGTVRFKFPRRPLKNSIRSSKVIKVKVL